MKRITLALATVAMAGGLMAQSNQLSFGADIALPMGDFGEMYSLGIGPTVGFELPVGDQLGLTAQIGYEFLSIKSDYKVDGVSATMMPIQVGAKYYFQDSQEGIYGQAQLGMHTLGSHGDGVSISSTNFSWAIGVGYQLEKLDIGLRYNSISPDSDIEGAKASSYIGLRVAYLLSLN